MDMFTDYSKFILSLAKPGQDIIDSLSPEKAHVWHMASCIMEEAGELFSALKKMIIYDGIINRDDIIEELGDLMFYLDNLRQALGLDYEEILSKNKDKLMHRYPGGKYTDKSAQLRLDKQTTT